MRRMWNLQHSSDVNVEGGYAEFEKPYIPRRFSSPATLGFGSTERLCASLLMKPPLIVKGNNRDAAGNRRTLGAWIPTRAAVNGSGTFACIHRRSRMGAGNSTHPIHRAGRCGDLNVVRRFLGKPAILNRRDIDDMTCLHWYVQADCGSAFAVL